MKLFVLSVERQVANLIQNNNLRNIPNPAILFTVTDNSKFALFYENENIQQIIHSSILYHY